MNNETFENKLKPILLWMGTIVSGIMSIAYIIIVFVLVEGFQAKALLQTTIFSIITAIIGFCIMQMLKIQGQTFAKNNPENKKVLDEYTKIVLNKSTEKEKKKKSIESYWISSTIIDFIIKCGTLVLTSVGMVYIMIEGSKDYSLLLLAVVNLLMFAGFGFISLVKTYDFYNDQYVPYMKDKILVFELSASSTITDTTNKTGISKVNDNPTPLIDENTEIITVDSEQTQIGETKNDDNTN